MAHEMHVLIFKMEATLLGNALINSLPHYPPLGLHVGKTRGFDSVLNGRCAPRVGDLTLDLIKSPSNPLSGTRVKRGFDHLTCPNGEVFNHLFGQITTLPHPLPQGDGGGNN